MTIFEEDKKYRWEYPSEWLNEKIEDARDRGDVSFLVGVIDALLPQLPEDDVQDRFQDEMIADGYFAPVEGNAE